MKKIINSSEILEEEFGIEVPDEEAANLKQVSDLVAFIEKNSKK